jgi:hypothetical protein
MGPGFKNLQELIKHCESYNVSSEDAIKMFKDNFGKDPNSSEKNEIQRKLGSPRTPRIPSSNTGNIDKYTKTDIINKVISASEYQSYMPGINEEMVKFSDISDVIINKEGKLNDLRTIGTNLLNNSVDAVETFAKQQSALLTQINEKAGLTGEYSKAFREELTKANPRLLQLGIGFGELADAAGNYIQKSGRFATINQGTWERAGEVAKAYVGTLDGLVAMYPEFEKVGLGASDAQERIAQAGKQSIVLGLQAQKTTSEISANLGRLNEYGFKNGVEGLASMVRKATEFRMSMNEVFQIAEKVMSPEGAIDLSANLQVLGGAIGDFNDPLKLMYMATNNVEGLQDALIGATGGLALFNEEQGRFEITGINLRKAKAMADSLGVSYAEFSKGAIAAAERSKAASELAARGLTLTDEQREFITNISQMKGGKMTIELNSEELQKEFRGKEVALEDLTQESLARLVEFQDEFKKQTAEDVVRKQATDIENMSRDISYMKALLIKEFGTMSMQAAEDLNKKIFGEGGAASKTLSLSKDFRVNVENKGSETYQDIKNLAKEIVGDKTKKENTTNVKPETKKTTTTTTTTTPKTTETKPVNTPKPEIPLSYNQKFELPSEYINETRTLTAISKNNLNNFTGLNTNIGSLADIMTYNAKSKPIETKNVSPIVDNSKFSSGKYDDLKNNILAMYKPKEETATSKKEGLFTHNVKITLQANNGLMDKAYRGLLESPELESKLVDSLSYLSESYV